MADTVQKVIPKYIDKSVYYVTSDNKEYSYPIKSTYKGILRLSPNNGNSLTESTDVQLIDFSNKAETSSYKDSLNEFFDEGKDTNRLVKLSTSDGYFVDMRLNMNAVEFDNLYIDGVFSGKTEKPFNFENKNTVLLFSKPEDETCFMLGDTTAMPIHANAKKFSEDAKEDPLDEIYPVDYKYTLGEDKDNSAILTARDMDNKRVFQYKNTDELIEELVQEALMSFHTVPTGSIHFVPVTINQYKQLIESSKTYPNKPYFKDKETKKNTDGNNEPIIRDFLLCDGRKYWIKDFPELAKVLNGEKISYERLVQIPGPDGSVWRRYEHKNVYNEKTTWFRVPDLRHMFIRSPYLSKDLIDNENNDTGTWNVDNVPTIPQDKELDAHYHFIALPEYNAEASRTDFDDIEDYPGLVLNGMSSSMEPNVVGTNTQYDLFTTCNSTGRNAHGLENHTPAIHFFTAPETITKENYTDDDYIPDSGLTGENIVDDTIPDKANNLDYGMYKNRIDEFNTSDMTNEGACRFGMENTPEFYACVPLIKI